MTLEVEVCKSLREFNIDLYLTCPPGTLLALTGPSGAGKTTVIRMIAGLDRPDQGRIRLGNTLWTDTAKGLFLPPQKRNLGYVFQEYTLFPHLTVEKNVAFAATDKDEVHRLLELLGISHLCHRRPHEISGGERQRTALAQALAKRPRVLLMDEPFSSLDLETKKRLWKEVVKIKKRFSIPMILVTHDPQEMLMLADKVMTIENGRIRKDRQWPSFFIRSVFSRS